MGTIVLFSNNMREILRSNTGQIVFIVVTLLIVMLLIAHWLNHSDD